METSQHGKLHQLFDSNFIDYTSYVIKERAIPDVADGLKPVQRRILQTLHNMDDGRFHKVANVVGETMKLHPHGDASIFAALVNLANKEYLIERQGNFGNIYTGDQASAARYIECRLTPMARATLFNKDLTEYNDSYDGRMLEPVSLPAKLPMLLMLGAEGIAVGMATKIMPHNFVELLEAQKCILREEPFEILPDFPKGGLLDAGGYEKGNGRIKCRARIVEKDEKTILITEIPHTTTTESLIESVEKAARSGKIKIMSINDYTAEDVEVEIKLARGVYAEDTIKALYAFSDCEVPISPNLTVIKNGRPEVTSVDDILRFNTEKLVNDLEKELKIELGRLNDRLHASLLEQIFIEERIYKEIEECPSYDKVIKAVDAGLAPFADKLLRPVEKEDVERLLEIRIKRISRYDINKKNKEIKELRKSIKQVTKHLKDMVGFTINYIDSLLVQYGPLYPRRTELTTFSEVEVRELALSNLIMGYDQETGFLGSQIKGEGNFSFTCTEYDKVLIIFKDGLYKVINLTEKLFVGHDVIWCGKAGDKTVFNIIYRDGGQGHSFVKRFKSPKFILEKEYRLFDEHPKSEVQYLSVSDKGAIKINFVANKRAKSNVTEFTFDEFLVKGVAAIGKRISNRVVRKITPIAKKSISSDVETPQPNLFAKNKKEGPKSE